DYLPKEDRTPFIKELVMKKPIDGLIKAKNYINHIAEDERVSLLNNLAMKNPESALLFAKYYIDSIPEKDGRDLLERAAKERIASLNGMREEDLEHTKKYLNPETIDNLIKTYEKKTNALYVGSELNRNHDLPTEQRFAPIKNYDSKQLYELLTFGRQEMFTSTYLHVFDRLEGKLNKEGKNVYDIADPKYSMAITVFLESASTYNRLDKAVHLIPKEKWGDILTKFGDKINDGNMAHVVALAEVMKAMPDKDIKQQMEKFVQEKFNIAPEGSVRDSYGVLASHYNKIADGKKVKIDNPDNYKIPVLEGISNKELLGNDGIYRQLLVFSDDKDGKNSYDNFIMQYSKNKNKYQIEDKGDFIKITPIGTDTKTKMEIYANKPDRSPDSIIRSIGGDFGTVESIEFDNVTHRGHGSNLDNTMPYFSSNNALIFLGSGGSYGNIEKLLKIAPQTQIISTKEVGTMLVNDQLLFNMNESIRKGESLVWKDKQEYLDGLGGKHAEAYVLPHRNTALLMQRKINELDDKRNESREKAALIQGKLDIETVALKQAGVIQTAHNVSAYNNVPAILSNNQLGT
ncbi:MAG: hypothetical protein ABL867_06705, partial [Rickettsiales bacterium]